MASQAASLKAVLRNTPRPRRGSSPDVYGEGHQHGSERTVGTTELHLLDLAYEELAGPQSGAQLSDRPSLQPLRV